MTRYFWRLIAPAGSQAVVRAFYLERYPLTRDAITGDLDEPDTRRALGIGLGRTLDAQRLLDELANGDHDTAVDGFTTVGASTRAGLKAAGDALRTWFATQFMQPEPNVPAAWNPRFLEYQFAIATDTTDRGQTIPAARWYTQGHLDWFALDVDVRPGAQLVRADGSTATSTPDVKPLALIPAPVQLQRAQMPAAENEPKRRPRTKVLQPAPGHYFINEEEVPRSGKLVTRGYQRTRWLDGATLTWVGRRVTIGRGEGSSGLAFDQAVNVKPGT